MDEMDNDDGIDTDSSNSSDSLQSDKEMDFEEESALKKLHEVNQQVKRFTL